MSAEVNQTHLTYFKTSNRRLMHAWLSWWDEESQTSWHQWSKWEGSRRKSSQHNKRITKKKRTNGNTLCDCVCVFAMCGSWTQDVDENNDLRESDISGLKPLSCWETGPELLSCCFKTGQTTQTDACVHLQVVEGRTTTGRGLVTH